MKTNYKDDRPEVGNEIWFKNPVFKENGGKYQYRFVEIYLPVFG